MAFIHSSTENFSISYLLSLYPNYQTHLISYLKCQASNISTSSIQESTPPLQMVPFILVRNKNRSNKITRIGILN